MSGKRQHGHGQHAEPPRVVLDTGALIALDEQHPVERVRDIVAVSAAAERRLFIPAVVVAEWWRGDNRAHHRNSRMFKVEAVTEVIAKSAGEALKTDKYTVVRGGGKELVVKLTDPTTRDDVLTGKDVLIDVKVVQMLGGNAAGANVFITREAKNGSTLVLFQHEIGHLPGMVPNTQVATWYGTAFLRSKGSTARSGASSRAGPVGGGYPQLLLGVHVPSVQAQFGNGHVYPHAPQLPLTVPLVSQPVVDPQSSQPGRQA
jgi:hypothetical protein